MKLALCLFGLVVLSACHNNAYHNTLSKASKERKNG
jgi:hypothetical protein